MIRVIKNRTTSGKLFSDCFTWSISAAMSPEYQLYVCGGLWAITNWRRSPIFARIYMNGNIMDEGSVCELEGTSSKTLWDDP